MTSLSLSRQKAEGGNQQDFSYKYHKESGTDVFASIYQYKTSMHLVKPSGNQKEQDMKQSHVHQSDVMGDAIKVERGELIARKDHTAPKHLCSYVKEDDYSSVNMNKQFFVQLACMFMVIGNIIKNVTNLNLLNLKRVIGLATLECVGWGYCVIAGSLSTVLPYGFGGKRSYPYGSLNSIIYASWIRYFGRYIYNLDFEYATRDSFKLVYSYIRAFDSSRMIWNQATLSSEFATLYCNKLYTLVYLLSEWSFSGIIIYDKYHRQFLFGLTLVCKAILLNQCFLLHSCVNWEELRPLVTSRAYGIKEGFKPCVIQKQFMPWYALVSLSPLSLLSLTILLCHFYYCCFCYYFIVTDLYKTILSLSFSLLLSLYISFLCSLLLLTVCCESNPAHPVALAYFSLLLLAVWCWRNPVHTDTVVYSCCLLSFLELSLAGYDDELLLAVGALYLFNYRTEGLRIDGNSCLYLLSPPAPAPHSKCLGQSVARFKRPFESRPADPARRERFLHLVTQPGTSGMIPATATISATPRPLDRPEGPSSAHRGGFQCRRRLKF